MDEVLHLILLVLFWLCMWKKGTAHKFTYVRNEKYWSLHCALILLTVKKVYCVGSVWPCLFSMILVLGGAGMQHYQRCNHNHLPHIPYTEFTWPCWDVRSVQASWWLSVAPVCPSSTQRATRWVILPTPDSLSKYPNSTAFMWWVWFVFGYFLLLNG